MLEIDSEIDTKDKKTFAAKDAKNKKGQVAVTSGKGDNAESVMLDTKELSDLLGAWRFSFASCTYIIRAVALHRLMIRLPYSPTLDTYNVLAPSCMWYPHTTPSSWTKRTRD